MKKMTLQRIEAELDAISARRRADLDTLAAGFRKNVLLPFCQKHNLDFISGMGTFFFVADDEDGDEVTVNDSISAKGFGDHLSHLLPVLEAMEIEIDRGDYFGYYVGDVKVRKAATR